MQTMLMDGNAMSDAEERRKQDREEVQEWATIVQMDVSVEDEVSYPVMIEDIHESGAGFYCQYELPMGSRWRLMNEDGEEMVEICTIWGHLDEGFYRYGASVLSNEEE